MQRYSFLSLLRGAWSGHENWRPAWPPTPSLQSAYDIIIIGAGGHGLATAFYLAKDHQLANVLVLEKGWLGGGNTGRNTTVIRSNYLRPDSISLYKLAHDLYGGLSRELNFNVMFSPRGLLMLCHTEHDVRSMRRISHAGRLQGVDMKLLSPAEIKPLAPILNCAPTARYPILGALHQKRGGTARHDAVAWGYARAAAARGVHIAQQCPAIAIHRDGGRVTGVETPAGMIRARKVAIVAAGHAGQVAAMAGLRLPLESKALQACVTEPLKPCLDVVIMANTVHGYISQSDKGELVIGGGADSCNNYNQRGSFSTIEHTLTALMEMFPVLAHTRMLRQWGGIVDMTGDRSPIISKTDIDGLYLNCGWGTGGFKAIPGSGKVFADTIANDRPHPFAAPFGLERFTTGRLIDESVAAAVAH